MYNYTTKTEKKAEDPGKSRRIPLSTKNVQLNMKIWLSTSPQNAYDKNKDLCSKIAIANAVASVLLSWSHFWDNRIKALLLQRGTHSLESSLC